MNDTDQAIKLFGVLAELAPYPSFVKSTAKSVAEQQLRANPQLAATALRLARETMFPCGHASAGCPSCPATDRLATAATPAPDPKEVGERVADRLRNRN